MGYAQPLRAIGQALEVLDIQDFEMEPAGDDFYVRGNIPMAAKKEFLSDQCSADELRAIWGALPSASDEFRDKQARADLSMLSRIELCYTVQDVERLEEEGRSRRGNSQKNADASSLSQVLRCVGAYLNQKRARLCKISREIDYVAIEYETSLGSRMKETLGLKDLYDLWVRMYLQRSERTQ
ncbi:MAG: hypothetical protein ACREQV_26020, partial [Candidatus Binatia bacterium]